MRALDEQLTNESRRRLTSRRLFVLATLTTAKAAERTKTMIREQARALIGLPGLPGELYRLRYHSAVTNVLCDLRKMKLVSSTPMPGMPGGKPYLYHPSLRAGRVLWQALK